MPATLACRLFPTENINAQQAQKDFSPLPLYLPREFRQESLFQEGNLSIFTSAHRNSVWQIGRTQASLLDSPVHHCFWVAQEFEYKMFALSRIVYFPFEVPYPCHPLEWRINLNCTIPPQVHIFMLPLCVYHNKFGHFLH